MQKVFLLITCCCCLWGCGADKKGDTVFVNDFESAKGWFSLDKLNKGEAHSGQFAMSTDSTNPYSKIFKLKFSEISDKTIGSVKFSIWCRSDKLPIKAVVVTAVTNDSTGQVIIWNGTTIEKEVTEPHQWIKIEDLIDLSKNAANMPNNSFAFYIYNTGGSTVLGDDVVLEFLN